MSLPFKKSAQTSYSNLNVYFDDKSKTSPDYFRVSDVPELLTKGKNLLRISAHPSNLKPNSRILVNIFDKNGNPIYYEIPDYLESDKSRVISIWVYHDQGDDNTANGDARITLFGIANKGPNGEPIPREFQNKYNVKWSTVVNVDRNRDNISTILFKPIGIPTASVSESIESYMNLPRTGTGLDLTTISGSEAQYIYKGTTPVIKVPSSVFTNEMLNYTITLSNFTEPATPNATIENPSKISTFTASISEVISGTSVIVNTPFKTTFDNRDGLIHTYNLIESADYSIQYFTSASNQSTENKRSYANISFDNINPISGIVNKLRVLIKSDGLPGDYELINEVTVPFSSSFDVKIPIPSEHLEDPKRLKIQYLNSIGEISRTETITDPFVFSGGNYYFGGGENLISGSMFISDKVGSGIELGGVSSGFVRSVGYLGITSASLGTGPGGFIIYSGSGNLKIGADTLEGVGIELVGDNDDRHLIFTTNGGGLLDIKTDKFFIGNENLQFISGSNSNIEISSSIFHLDPANNILFIGADAVISSSLTVNSIRTPALIGGTQSTRINASSSIESDGFAKFVSASIGSWDVTENTIQSNNLLLKSEGDIQTQNFVKNQRGWQISSKGNGAAEFENVRIRGTLGTTTFEKETVNAVGGQLYVGNSTTLSGSRYIVTTTYSGSFGSDLATYVDTTEIQISSDDLTTNSPDLTLFTKINDVEEAGTILFEAVATSSSECTVADLGGNVYSITLPTGYTWDAAELSNAHPLAFTNYDISETIYTASISPSVTELVVKNVQGFSSGEIITAKKISSTGFTSEYMKIASASSLNISSIDNSGVLFVTRSYGSASLAATSEAESPYLGNLMSISQSYDEGQVIVSTGKLNTGYIRINANPNDLSTPYIDIVERTGSGVTDVQLKARLGDLSGLSGSSYVFGNASPGFGLATDNVYLRGGIEASFGEIGGFGITQTAISSSNDNLILKSNGQITGSSAVFIYSGSTMLDTNSGFSDGQNVARPITRLSEFSGFGTVPVMFLPGETKLVAYFNKTTGFGPGFGSIGLFLGYYDDSSGIGIGTVTASWHTASFNTVSDPALGVIRVVWDLTDFNGFDVRNAYLEAGFSGDDANDVVIVYATRTLGSTANASGLGTPILEATIP